MKNNLLDRLKVDKKSLTISSLTDETDEKSYWLMQTPAKRLEHIELLRRINYGNGASARLQRIFEVVEREPS